MLTSDVSLELRPGAPEPIVLDLGPMVLHMTIAQAAQVRDALAEAIQELTARVVKS